MRFLAMVLGFTLIVGYSSSQLMKAVQENDLEKVKSLILTDRSSINEKDKNDETALMVAAKNGNLQLVKLLVENGADVNIIKGKFSEFSRAYKGDMSTALSLAVENNHKEVVRYLVQHKANINFPRYVGDTKVRFDDKYQDAFSLAMKNKNVTILSILLTKYDCNGYCPKKEFEILNDLYKINPTLVDIWVSHYKQLLDASPLDVYIKKAMYTGTLELEFDSPFDDEHYKLYKYLISKKYININKKDYEGLTSFDKCWIFENKSCVDYLKKFGASGPSAKALSEKKQYSAQLVNENRKREREEENHRTACAKMIYDHPTKSNTCYEICSTYFPSDWNCRSKCCECWNLLSKPSDGPCR